MAFNSNRTIVHYLKVLLSAHRRRVALNLTLLCVLGFVGGIGILLILPMLDATGVGSRADRQGIAGVVTQWFDSVGVAPTIFNVLVAFLALTGIHASLQYWYAIQNVRLQQDFIRGMFNDLFESIVHSTWPFYLTTRSSDFKHALHSDINRISKGTNAILQLISSGVISIVHVTLALLISPLMTLATVASMLFYWPLLARQNRIVHETGQSVTTEKKRLFANVDDQLGGMKELKVLVAETRQLQVIHQLTESISSARVSFARAQAGTSVVYTFGTALLLSGLLYTGIEVLNVPLSEFALICLIFARLMPKGRQMHMNYQQVLHMLPAFESASELQARCDAAREIEDADLTPTVALDRAITLTDVAFRYDQKSSTWALRDIRLTIPACRTTAVVGTSGAGKSTLADVMMGLLAPEQGIVQIDDQALNSASVYQWRRTVGYVPQETFLMHDTIRANLLWARPTASETELNAALSMAAADEFVNACPDGLDTVIGDRGTRLSGGERQRIALARALLRQPKVLILDEATSSLDSENQLRIHEAIQSLSGKLTIIVIAHRLSTVRNADQIVVLSAGRVAETGTWADLANREDGRLRALIEADDTSASVG